MQKLKQQHSKKYLKHWTLTVFLLGFKCLVIGQNLSEQGSNANSNVTMADQLRADGKIWGVVAVLSIILAAIFIFLINTERRLKKLEKETKEL